MRREKEINMRFETMIHVSENISIDESEIQESFVRSSGPGGQNVNKVSTAVQLRFDAKNSPSLPEEVRLRLLHKAGKKVTNDGVLIISARRFRTQEKNRRDALNRLIALIHAASIEPPKSRPRTRPSRQSSKRRLEAKHRRSLIKQMRNADPLTDF